MLNSRGPFAYTTPFVKCFSFEYASNALWKTFAENTVLLRLTFTLDGLLRTIGASSPPVPAKAYVVRTRYLTGTRITEEVRRLESTPPAKKVGRYAVPALTLKREGFSYENEVRVCIMADKDARSMPSIQLANVTPENICRVLIDPYMPSWQAREIKSLLVNQVGVGVPVEQSLFNADIDN
jgi:hypothetical protein